MNTTSLFVELIIIGVGAAVGIGLLVASRFDPAWLPGIDMPDPIPAALLGLAAIFALSAIYVLGIIMDRLADWVFRFPAAPLVKRRFGNWEEYRHARTLVYTHSAGLRDMFEYGRSRLRICRGWAMNAVLIALGVIAYAAQMPDPYARASVSRAGVVAFGLLAVCAGLAWRALADGEYRTLSEQSKHISATSLEQKAAGIRNSGKHQGADRVLNRYQTNEMLGYSQAVSMGDVLYVSGQVAVDERGEVVGGRDDIRAHVEQVFKNLRAVIEAGGSRLDLVVKMTVYTTSLEYLPAIREARRQMFGPLRHWPASTLVVVSGLARPEYLVEIEAICGVAR